MTIPATALPQHVLARDDMRAALARHDFGAVFYLARKWAGLSYSKIAERCDIKPDRVGLLARGEGTIAHYAKIVQIADALRIPGNLLGLAPRPWETASTQPALPSFVTARRSHQPRNSGVYRRVLDEVTG